MRYDASWMRRVYSTHGRTSESESQFYFIYESANFLRSAAKQNQCFRSLHEYILFPCLSGNQGPAMGKRAGEPFRLS